MLTDYERYQLEWMIEHGHSLKEFVQGLDLVDRDGIDSLEDAYAIWENDYGFGGEVFSNEREFKEEDLPEIMRKPEHETDRPLGRPARHPPSSQRRMAAPTTLTARMSARRDAQMVSERDSYLDADDTTVSVTQSLHDAQAPSHDDGDAHEDGRAVLREAVQVTSHGRVVSCAVHERPVSIHGESARARAAAAALAAHVDAEDEVEEKEDKRRSR